MNCLKGASWCCKRTAMAAKNHPRASHGNFNTHASIFILIILSPIVVQGFNDGSSKILIEQNGSRQSTYSDILISEAGNDEPPTNGGRETGVKAQTFGQIVPDGTTVRLVCPHAMATSSLAAPGAIVTQPQTTPVGATTMENSFATNKPKPLNGGGGGQLVPTQQRRGEAGPEQRQLKSHKLAAGEAHSWAEHPVKWFRNHVQLLNSNHPTRGRQNARMGLGSRRRGLLPHHRRHEANFSSQLRRTVYPPNSLPDEAASALSKLNQTDEQLQLEQQRQWQQQQQQLEAWPDFDPNQTATIHTKTLPSTFGNVNELLQGRKLLLNSTSSFSTGGKRPAEVLKAPPSSPSEAREEVGPSMEDDAIQQPQMYINKFGELVITRVSKHFAGEYTCLSAGQTSHIQLDVYKADDNNNNQTNDEHEAHVDNDNDNGGGGGGGDGESEDEDDGSEPIATESKGNEATRWQTKSTTSLLEQVGSDTVRADQDVDQLEEKQWPPHSEGATTLPAGSRKFESKNLDWTTETVLVGDSSSSTNWSLQSPSTGGTVGGGSKEEEEGGSNNVGVVTYSETRNKGSSSSSSSPTLRIGGAPRDPTGRQRSEQGARDSPDPWPVGGDGGHVMSRSNYLNEFSSLQGASQQQHQHHNQRHHHREQLQQRYHFHLHPRRPMHLVESEIVSTSDLRLIPGLLYAKQQFHCPAMGQQDLLQLLLRQIEPLMDAFCPVVASGKSTESSSKNLSSPPGSDPTNELLFECRYRAKRLILHLIGSVCSQYHETSAGTRRAICTETGVSFLDIIWSKDGEPLQFDTNGKGKDPKLNVKLIDFLDQYPRVASESENVLEIDESFNHGVPDNISSSSSSSSSSVVVVGGGPSVSQYQEIAGRLVQEPSSQVVETNSGTTTAATAATTTTTRAEQTRAGSSWNKRPACPLRGLTLEIDGIKKDNAGRYTCALKLSLTKLERLLKDLRRQNEPSVAIKWANCVHDDDKSPSCDEASKKRTVVEKTMDNNDRKQQSEAATKPRLARSVGTNGPQAAAAPTVANLVYQSASNQNTFPKATLAANDKLQFTSSYMIEGPTATPTTRTPTAATVAPPTTTIDANYNSANIVVVPIADAGATWAAATDSVARLVEIKPNETIATTEDGVPNLVAPLRSTAATTIDEAIVLASSDSLAKRTSILESILNGWVTSERALDYIEQVTGTVFNSAPTNQPASGIKPLAESTLQTFILIVSERSTNSCSVWSTITEANQAYSRRKLADFKRLKRHATMTTTTTKTVAPPTSNEQQQDGPDKRRVLADEDRPRVDKSHNEHAWGSEQGPARGRLRRRRRGVAAIQVSKLDGGIGRINQEDDQLDRASVAANNELSSATTARRGDDNSPVDLGVGRQLSPILAQRRNNNNNNNDDDDVHGNNHKPELLLNNVVVAAVGPRPARDSSGLFAEISGGPTLASPTNDEELPATTSRRSGRSLNVVAPPGRHLGASFGGQWLPSGVRQQQHHQPPRVPDAGVGSPLMPTGSSARAWGPFNYANEANLRPHSTLARRFIGESRRHPHPRRRWPRATKVAPADVIVDEPLASAPAAAAAGVFPYEDDDDADDAADDHDDDGTGQPESTSSSPVGLQSASEGVAYGPVQGLNRRANDDSLNEASSIGSGQWRAEPETKDLITNLEHRPQGNDIRRDEDDDDKLARTMRPRPKSSRLRLQRRSIDFETSQGVGGPGESSLVTNGRQPMGLQVIDGARRRPLDIPSGPPSGEVINGKTKDADDEYLDSWNSRRGPQIGASPRRVTSRGDNDDGDDDHWPKPTLAEAQTDAIRRPRWRRYKLPPFKTRYHQHHHHHHHRQHHHQQRAKSGGRRRADESTGDHSSGDKSASTSGPTTTTLVMDSQARPTSSTGRYGSNALASLAVAGGQFGSSTGQFEVETPSRPSVPGDTDDVDDGHREEMTTRGGDSFVEATSRLSVTTTTTNSGETTVPIDRNLIDPSTAPTWTGGVEASAKVAAKAASTGSSSSSLGEEVDDNNQADDDADDETLLWEASQYLYLHMRAFASLSLYGVQVDVEWSNERVNGTTSSTTTNDIDLGQSSATISKANNDNNSGDDELGRGHLAQAAHGAGQQQMTPGEQLIGWHDVAPFATIDLVSGQTLHLECTAQALGRLPEVKWYKRIRAVPEELTELGMQIKRRIGQDIYWPLAEIDLLDDVSSRRFVSSQTITIFDNLMNQTFTVVNSMQLSQYDTNIDNNNGNDFSEQRPLMSSGHMDGEQFADLTAAASDPSEQTDQFACIVDADVRHNYATLAVHYRDTSNKMIPLELRKRIRAKSILEQKIQDSRRLIGRSADKLTDPNSLGPMVNLVNGDSLHSYYRKSDLEFPLQSFWVPIKNRSIVGDEELADMSSTTVTAITPAVLSGIIVIVFGSLLALVYLTLRSYQALTKFQLEGDDEELDTNLLVNAELTSRRQTTQKNHRQQEDTSCCNLQPDGCSCGVRLEELLSNGQRDVGTLTLNHDSNDTSDNHRQSAPMLLSEGNIVCRSSYSLYNAHIHYEDDGENHHLRQFMTPSSSKVIPSKLSNSMSLNNVPPYANQIMGAHETNSPFVGQCCGAKTAVGDDITPTTPLQGKASGQIFPAAHRVLNMIENPLNNKMSSNPNFEDAIEFV